MIVASRSRRRGLPRRLDAGEDPQADAGGDREPRPGLGREPRRPRGRSARRCPKPTAATAVTAFANRQPSPRSDAASAAPASASAAIATPDQWWSSTWGSARRAEALELGVRHRVDPGRDRAEQRVREQRHARMAGQPEQRPPVRRQHAEEDEAHHAGDPEPAASGRRPSGRRTDRRAPGRPTRARRRSSPDASRTRSRRRRSGRSRRRSRRRGTDGSVWDGSSETNEMTTNGRDNPMVATPRSHPTMRKASIRPREARASDRISTSLLLRSVAPPSAAISRRRSAPDPPRWSPARAPSGPPESLPRRRAGRPSPAARTRSPTRVRIEAPAVVLDLEGEAAVRSRQPDHASDRRRRTSRRSGAPRACRSRRWPRRRPGIVRGRRRPPRPRDGSSGTGPRSAATRPWSASSGG